MSEPAVELTTEEKRKARQAKLLAKGAARLEKITGAAGADRIVSADSSIPKVAVTRPDGPPPPTSLAETFDVVDDPLEVDISSLPMSPALVPSTSAQSTASGRFTPIFGGDPMSGGPDMLAQMMQQMMAPGPPGSPDAGLGIGGMFSSLPSPGPGLTPPTPPTVAPPKTLLDRLFPLVHLLSMVALAVYAVGWLEPARKFGMYGWMGLGAKVDWAAWGALTRRPPANDVLDAVGQMSGVGIAEVPLIWLFVSVELILQTTRLFLVRNSAMPPSLIATILPFVSQFSPQLGLLIHTAVKYLALLAIIVNDLAVLIFCIGVAVVVGRFRTGPDAGVMEQIVEGSGAGWNAARVEL